MSALTEALARISRCMEARHPFPEKDGKKLPPLRPGLSDEDIHELTKDFPFRFPQELRELYAWHNGDWCHKDTRFSRDYENEVIEFIYGKNYDKYRFFPDTDIGFLTLQQAVYHPSKANGGKDICLGIFSEENGYISVIINNSESSPVLIDNNIISFPSLTNMMLAVAECLETMDTLHISNQLPKRGEEREKQISNIAAKYNGHFDRVWTGSFCLD